MDDKLKNILAFLLCWVLLLVVISPIFTIWSLNTLFGFKIAYDFTSWVAVLWLTLLIKGVNVKTKDSN